MHIRRHRQSQRAEDAAAIAESRRDDVVIDAGFDFAVGEMTAELVWRARADRCEQPRVLHHPAAEDDALRRQAERQLGSSPP